MQWRGRRQSDNIEDRRGGRKAGGIGIGSIVIALILWKVFGIDPQTTLGVAQQMHLLRPQPKLLQNSKPPTNKKPKLL